VWRRPVLLKSYSPKSPGLIVKEATGGSAFRNRIRQRLMALARLPAEQALQELSTPVGRNCPDDEVDGAGAIYGANTAGNGQRAGFSDGHSCRRF